MGLLAGQPVRRSGTAPLGDPSIYFVRGFRLALRRSEARRVLIDHESVEPATD
jgi:ferrous iron transport protein A